MKIKMAAAMLLCSFVMMCSEVNAAGPIGQVLQSASQAAAPVVESCGCEAAADEDCGCRQPVRGLLSRLRGGGGSAAPAGDCGCEPVAPIVEESCGCESAAPSCGCGGGNGFRGLLQKLAGQVPGDCGCGAAAPAPIADCGCDAAPAAGPSCGCQVGGLIGQLRSRSCGCGAASPAPVADCGCAPEPAPAPVPVADCGCAPEPAPAPAPAPEPAPAPVADCGCGAAAPVEVAADCGCGTAAPAADCGCDAAAASSCGGGVGVGGGLLGQRLRGGCNHCGDSSCNGGCRNRTKGLTLLNRLRGDRIVRDTSNCGRCMPVCPDMGCDSGCGCSSCGDVGMAHSHAPTSMETPPVAQPRGPAAPAATTEGTIVPSGGSTTRLAQPVVDSAAFVLRTHR